MSYKANSNQQLTLNDSFINQTPRTQKIIRNSWCNDFADIVFPAINEERFAVLYSNNAASRPNTPVNFIVGALMLKEHNNLNDDELLESICCDIRYQFALHTTHLCEQPVSDRTFSRFRERLYHYELETGENLLVEEMMHLAQTYQNYMNLNSNIKRMDSLMIASRCKHMSRLEIIYQTTANAVHLIHRLGHDEMICGELSHYMNDDDHNQVIYYCKGEDATPRLEKVIQEAEVVMTLMEDEAWHEFSEYQLLLRVLNEQSRVSGDGIAVPKEKSEILSDSLQNPSDPDATYRSKAGKSHKGYVGNIIETVGEDGDSLITDVAFAQNIHSDSAFCKEYLNTRSGESAAEILIADGAYSGKENQRLADACNTQLITTTLTGKGVNEIYAGFQFTEDGRTVISCPMGYAPEKTTYYPRTGMCRVLFAKDCCENCPNKNECKCKPQKKNYAVHVSASMSERAQYVEKLKEEEYVPLTRKRNAVEGIMSVLRRKLRVDEIPVLGYVRTRQFFLFKIGAYNFKKLVKHNRRLGVESAQNLVIA